MNILVSALEPSANLHLKEILKHLNNYNLVGIFDESLGEPIYSQKEFSVMGIVDVIPKIALAKKAIIEMSNISKDVDVVLLIDAPSFNLPLAKSIKKLDKNIQIIYYILPKVWAWKKFRAKIVDKYIDYPISIFPFEKIYFKKSIYNGNPIMDEVKPLKAISTKNYISFLAGSRKSEIRLLLPVFKKLVKHLDCKPILIIPSHFTKDEIDNVYGNIDEFEISKDITKSITKSSFAFVCSGTATLEVAILGVPFILVYKARAVEYYIAKMLVDLSTVGLANIILKYENISNMHPEIIQNSLTLEKLIEEYKTYNYDNFFQKHNILVKLLKIGASREVANLVNNI
jgi:lipid-A-disaccharide synthase